MKNIFLIFIILISGPAGCTRPGNKLYVLKTCNIPSEKDWAGALPYNISVEKGKLNRSSPKISKLDKETIHSSNRTCHHEEPSDPVNIELSAFYNDSHLFLRIKWPDKNKDDAPALWDMATGAFDKAKGNEDGFGIIWNRDKNTSSNCLSYCHLNDWQVRNSILSPIHHMKTKNSEKYDFWVWWAGRNTKENSVWNTAIDSSGIDEPSPFYIGDTSYIQKYPGKNNFFLQNAERTHNIYSESSYKDGFWTLTITGPLNNSQKEFKAGNFYPFQIAVFDDTYSDHSISSNIEEMLFVKSKDHIAGDALWAARKGRFTESPLN